MRVHAESAIQELTPLVSPWMDTWRRLRADPPLAKYVHAVGYRRWPGAEGSQNGRRRLLTVPVVVRGSGQGTRSWLVGCSASPRVGRSHERSRRHLAPRCLLPRFGRNLFELRGHIRRATCGQAALLEGKARYGAQAASSSSQYRHRLLDHRADLPFRILPPDLRLGPSDVIHLSDPLLEGPFRQGGELLLSC